MGSCRCLLSSEGVPKPKYIQFTDWSNSIPDSKSCFLLFHMSTFGMLYYLHISFPIRLPPVISVFLLQPIFIVSYLGKFKAVSALLQTSSKVMFTSKPVLNISVAWHPLRISSH